MLQLFSEPAERKPKHRPPLGAGMVLETIAKCDVDIRKELYGGIVLTGGTALLTGVRHQPAPL